VTAKSHGEREVVDMNELQRRAVKDAIRYVKIQDKYTPEDLEAARALCLGHHCNTIHREGFQCTRKTLHLT
jgi:hypothetical protein